MSINQPEPSIMTNEYARRSELSVEIGIYLNVVGIASALAHMYKKKLAETSRVVMLGLHECRRLSLEWVSVAFNLEYNAHEPVCDEFVHTFSS